MIDFVSKLEDNDEKLGLVKAIANQMKKSYLLWNKETVADNVIYRDLKELSNQKIDIEKIDAENEHDINLSSSSDLTNGNYQSRGSSKRKNYKKNYRRKSN